MLYETREQDLDRMARRKRPAAERGLGSDGSKTQVLPALPSDPKSIEDRQAVRTAARKRAETRRMPRPTIASSCIDLSRSPLLVEIVTSVSVSPIARPDLIGKTIAGGEGVKGATHTGSVVPRSSPTGYAVPQGRYKTISRRRKKHKRRV